MRIALVFDRNRPDTWGIYFLRAFESLGIAVEHFWLRDAEAIPRGFDLYLRVDHGSYDRDWPKLLKPSAFIVSDTHLFKPYQAIVRQARQYTTLFCGHRDGALRLRRMGLPATWLPAACDPEIHSADPQPPTYDLAYVGSEGGLARSIFLQSLRERYPRSFLDTADHRTMKQIYSCARIGINWGYGDFPERGTFNMRCFEIMAAGALCLTNAVSDGSVEELGFRDQEHLVLYRNPSDVPSLIDYYLVHETERAAIAAAGQQQTLAHHTYADRVATLLAHVGLMPVASESLSR